MIDKTAVTKFISGNKKLVIIAASCFCFICLDIAFLLRLQLAALQSAEPKLAVLKQQLDNFSRESSQMQDLKNSQLGVKKRALLGAKKIISEGQIASLLQDISTLANKNEVKITQMKPIKETIISVSKQEKDAPASVKLTPFLITLEGYAAYHNLGRFINDLENTDTFIAVQDLKIVFQQADYFKQKTSLVLRAYVRK